MIKSFVLFLLISLPVVETSHAQESDILGSTTVEEIRNSHRIFDIYTNRYQPDSAAVVFLNNLEEEIDIKVCSERGATTVKRDSCVH